MKRRRQRQATIGDPIYRARYLVARGGLHSAALRDFCRQLGEPCPDHLMDDENAEGRFTFVGDCRCGLLWFGDGAGVGVVAHECFHATFWLFRRLGAHPLTESHEEAFAYYLEWLTRQVTRRLWRR